MTHIFYPYKNWSSIVVEKFHIIYSLKEKLADFAYTYSFNANGYLFDRLNKILFQMLRKDWLQPYILRFINEPVLYLMIKIKNHRPI